MGAMSPLDAMFLLGESREHPMHVGGLQLFERPKGAGPGYLSDVYKEILDHTELNPLFSRRLRRSTRELGYWNWVPDNNIDLEYHVRLSGLARPARIRELLELVSRLHGTLLDRHRPLWEMHLIESVSGNRFAVYTKVHHALLDGVSALGFVERALVSDARLRHLPIPPGLPPHAPRSRHGGGGSLAQLPGAVKAGVDGLAHGLGDALGLAPVALATAMEALRDEHYPLAYRAPRTMFNVRVPGARRFGAQSFDFGRIDTVRNKFDCTVNDVVLAMSAGALRRYLLGHNALPERPLVAMVPVSVRGGTDGENHGNALGTLLCDLATESEDPGARLERIQASMTDGKNMLSHLSPTQNLMIGAMGLGSAGIVNVLRPLSKANPPYNLIISNVAGPAEQTLYFNGAKMTGMYPASIVMDGQALNITVTSYDHQLHFGLTGCRRSVPHLQWMLAYLEHSLAELEHL